MYTYYPIVLLILAVCQFKIQETFSLIACAIILLAEALFFSYVESLGFGFFGSAIIFECMFLFVGLLAWHFKLGKIIVLVALLGIVLNLTGLTYYDNVVFYSNYYNWYATVNVVMMEIIVGLGFYHSILYSKLIKKG